MRHRFFAVVSDKGEVLPTTIRNKQGEAETQARLTEPWRYSKRRNLFSMVVVTVEVTEQSTYQPFAKEQP